MSTLFPPRSQDPGVDPLLATPPSTVSDEDLAAALSAPPPTARALRLTGILTTALVVVLGFLGGLVVQKYWGSSSAQVAGPAGARGGFDTANLPSGFPTGAGFPAGADPTTAPTGTGSGDSEAGATPTTGQVLLVDGDVIYLTQSDGTQLRVEIDEATTMEQTRTTSADVRDIKEGDTVTVTGTTTDSGLTATSVEVSK